MSTACFEIDARETQEQWDRPTSLMLLQRADARLRDESYWLRLDRADARDVWGQPCEPQDPHACRWSLIGALEFCNGDLPCGPREVAVLGILRAQQRLGADFRHTFPGEWEDLPTTTFALLKAVLAEAIREAEVQSA